MRPFLACLLVAAAVCATAAPGDHRARIAGFGGDRHLLEVLHERWPNLEYCRAYDPGRIDDMKALGETARELGIVYSIQSCAPAFPPGYLDEHNCWAVDFLGRKPPDLGSAHPVADYCHPATIAALKQNLDVALTEAGAASFSLVDYVWPYVGGRWGYSEHDIAAYRAALAETDDGLRVISPAGPATMSFWDYFYELSGLRFEPADVGCEAWDAYVPARPNEIDANSRDAVRRNFSLYYALYHYCWLRFAQECGEYAQSLGGEMQASLNPENFGNGTDLLMWGRLQATGEPWLEQWGSPWITIANYHNLWYFTRPYAYNGKRLGLIGETGAAGGHPDSGFGPSRPHYWDPDANYAVTYGISAAGGFDDREEDYIWADIDTTLNPEGSQGDCWRGYVRGMDGFLRYADDAPVRPATDVLSVSTRSVLYHADNSEYSTAQPYSLSAPLVELHVDYHQAYFPLNRDILEAHRVILFAPWEYPRHVAADLREWLEGSEDRVLITHSFVPTRPCKGLIQTPAPTIDEPEAAHVLGIKGIGETTVTEGEITQVAEAWRELFTLKPGARVSLPQPVVACEGTPLVTLGETPLVTEIRIPGGGRVIYLNFAAPERYQGPDDPQSGLLRAALSAALTQAGVEPQADGSPHWACAKYEVEGGHVFLLLDARTVGQARFTEETASMAPEEHLWLRLEPDTDYIIEDLVHDTIGRGRSDGTGRLRVYLSGRNIRLLKVRSATGP